MIPNRCAVKRRIGMVQAAYILLVEINVPPNCKLSAVYPIKNRLALRAHQIVTSCLQIPRLGQLVSLVFIRVLTR